MRALTLNLLAMKKILLIFIAFFSAMVCTSAAWPRSKVTVRTMLDASGALTRDDARNITSVSYDNLGNLLRISYGNGNYSSFVYSATGERLKATHVTGLATKAGIAGLAAVPEMFADDEAEKASAVALAAVAGTTEYEYRGPFVYRDGKAEKALFPGGYASLQGGVAFHFYTRDYLGNVRAVTNASTGAVEQALAYYPYGGIITDLGTGHALQPYKFGEKELVTANGLNEYDFGARRYYPAVPMFTSPDPSSEKYPWLSPYLYCASDPVNAIDPDGRVIIFVNGQHGSTGGSPAYWDGIDERIKSKIGDNKALYYDGSVGGWNNTLQGIKSSVSPTGNTFFWFESQKTNLNINQRIEAGKNQGYGDAAKILGNLTDNETIKFVSHSMGGAYTKGFIQGLQSYAEEYNQNNPKNKIDINNLIEFEVDFAPFQPKSQHSIQNIKTIVIQHQYDRVAGVGDMPGAKTYVTHQNMSWLKSWIKGLSEHSISGFADDIERPFFP